MKNIIIEYSTVKSIRGLSHIKKHFPNEDSVLLRHTGSHAIVAAVSDGHGSRKCFRAHTGSRFAVDVVRDICEKVTNFGTLKDVRGFSETLPIKIVENWKARVDNDLKSYPFSNAELQYDECKKNPYLAYGCTLLGSYITSHYGIFFQIGDGDIFASATDGTTKRLVADDNRFIGEETTSLCLPDAENDFRISVVDFSINNLDIIILATDGLSKSYAKDADLFQWTTDIRSMIQEKGSEAIDENLSTWLEEVSNEGSADDISMAVIALDKLRLDNVDEDEVTSEENDITTEKTDEEKSKISYIIKIIRKFKKFLNNE